MQFFDQFILAFLLCLLALVQPVEASMTPGDVIALLLGLTIAFFGICACIGKYARSQA